MTAVRRRVALAAAAAVTGLAACLTVLLAAGALLAHGSGVGVGRVVVCGSPGAVVVAGVAAAATLWQARRSDERRRLETGLIRRVRLADEITDRHRHLSETASVGMSELISGLVAAEEAARGQLAAELHDTVAQSLGGARSLLADGDADPRRHRLVHELVAEAEEQVRAVMARTRPPAFRDGDLGRAVAGLRDDLGNRYGVVVAVEWPADPQPLPLATAVTVYRFFQEALLNVVKHADVDTAHATLRIDGDWLEACVQDDGAGFDPDDVRSEGGRHVGLGLLQQRARLMGGSVSVGSWPDPGTTVTLRLPCTATGASGRLPVPRLTAVG